MILCLTTPGDTGYNGDPLEISNDLLPSSITIGSPYPNPFNGSVSVPINIIKPSAVHFTIYDVGGSLVFSSNRKYNNGIENVFFWDGKNSNGNIVSSGNYYISATNNTFNETKRILFIK